MRWATLGREGKPVTFRLQERILEYRCIECTVPGFPGFPRFPPVSPGFPGFRAGNMRAVPTNPHQSHPEAYRLSAVWRLAISQFRDGLVGPCSFVRPCSF